MFLFSGPPFNCLIHGLGLVEAVTRLHSEPCVRLAYRPGPTLTGSGLPLPFTTTVIVPPLLLQTSFYLTNMSIIPPPLGRRSSTWSVLRSLDTLSPPPSWPSLDNLTACGQAGSIPLILHEGIGDFPNFPNGTSSDEERYGSSPMDPFCREYKAGSTDNNRAVGSIYHKPPKQGLVTPCTKPHEETRAMESRAVLLPHHPQRTPQSPEFSPKKPRRMVYKNKYPFHAAAKKSPTSCNQSSGPQATPPSSSPCSLGTGSECRGPSEHKRKGSISTTDSGSSSRSNLLFTTRDVNHVVSEKASINSVRFPLLPLALSWLQSTTLEVMIDQEGFRMTKPVFRFAGYSRPTTTESDIVSHGAHLVSASVDFMPLQRKSFAFHHSVLDTPPVLRRLMVNGDRSSDYLSRQAYLILKSNGPYTVQGTEPVQSSRLLSTGPAVLTWRFDYLVADRRTEAGRVIPGEKTLTPLSFTCSPALLQPAQAKKIRVVHVVKKGVVAKLTATKMEPPMPPPCLVADAMPSFNAESETHEAATIKLKSAHPNLLQDTLTLGLGISIHDSAQLSSSILHHGTGGAFLPISGSP
jgi:hypothetical protein